MDRERAQTTTDIWTYAEPSLDAASLIGYSVEATDGGIGKIDEATGETGRSHLIVSAMCGSFETRLSDRLNVPAGSEIASLNRQNS